MKEDELPQAIKDYNFAKNDKGDPILPPRTHPLGQRLRRSLPNGFGEVSWGLKPAAQVALWEKRFTLVTSIDGKTGLHPDTPRAGGRPQKPMTDTALAQAIKDYNFATNDKGDPILPPQSTRLGQRLHNALANNGHVMSALKTEAQAALWEKRFTLVTSTDGRSRVGLHPSTPAQAEDTSRRRGDRSCQRRRDLRPVGPGSPPGRPLPCHAYQSSTYR
ncbi:hypothetical protein AB0911_37510 [Streptomyces nigra]|uniref:hypothetical protein n=1 Tax=Streptomyces nigra TaxID=1827580 RepID=UPI00345303A4